MIQKEIEQTEKQQEFLNTESHRQLLNKRREYYLDQQQKTRNQILAKSRTKINKMFVQSKQDIEQNQKQSVDVGIEVENSIDSLIQEMNITENNKKNQNKKTKNNFQPSSLNEDEEYKQIQNNQCQNQQFSEQNIQESESQDFNAVDQENQFKNKKFTKILVEHEFLVNIPQEFEQNYISFSKPAGRRCIVISGNQKIQVRKKNGEWLKHFTTSDELPGGSSQSEKGNCILDCILNEDLKCFFILDIIQWKNIENVYENSAEMRFFWLDSNFSQFTNDQKISNSQIITEEESIKNNSNLQKIPENRSERHYKFYSVERKNLSQQNLQEIYYKEYGYLKEGIIFVEKDSPYDFCFNPFYLIWKDKYCSQYSQVTQNIAFDQKQVFAILKIRNKNKLATFDNVILYEVNEELFQSFKLNEKSLVKVHLQGIQVKQEAMEIQNTNYGNISDCLQVQASGLQVIQKIPRCNRTADSISKIIFQLQVRNLYPALIQFEDLLQGIK